MDPAAKSASHDGTEGAGGAGCGGGQGAGLSAEAEEQEGRAPSATTPGREAASGCEGVKCIIPFPSGIARTAIEGWSEDWHGCVYIDLPTGQVSWHYHDSHAPLFADLPAYTKPWDGHDTDEKYRRLAALDVAWLAALKAAVSIMEDFVPVSSLLPRLEQVVREALHLAAEGPADGKS